MLADAEIRRRAELDFALSEPLRRALDVLLSEPFRPVLAAGRLGLKAALQLAGMEAADRSALLAVFRSCGFSESQQGLVLQMLEEIAFREKKTLAAAPGRRGPGLPAGGGDAAEADSWPRCTRCATRRGSSGNGNGGPGRKKAAAGAGLSLAHAPFFASEEVQVTLTVKDRGQAEKLLAGLKKIL